MTRARTTNREPSGRTETDRTAGELVIIPPEKCDVWRAWGSGCAGLTMAAGAPESIPPDVGGCEEPSALAAQPDGDQAVAPADAELAEDVTHVTVKRRRRDADFGGDQLLGSIGQQEREHAPFHGRQRRARDQQAVREHDLPV